MDDNAGGGEMIRQCIGIHNNNCTEVAEHASPFCEDCRKEYDKACAKSEAICGLSDEKNTIRVIRVGGAC